MSTLSLFSLYYTHPDLSAARFSTDHPVFIQKLIAEPSNHVFLNPTTIVSRRHAPDEHGGGQSGVCALHGMNKFNAAQEEAG